jgi:GT2 family glycosyltransferase
MFDIVIPILKMKPKYMAECLASIKSQQFKRFKCYIVDGTPDDWEHYDESMKTINHYLKNDDRFEYHRHPNLDEPYVSEAQNYGLSLGSNPYVQFLGGDDFFYTHHLISIRDAIRDEIDENIGFWFCMVKANDKKIIDFDDFKIGRVKTFLLNHYLVYPYLSTEMLPFFHYGNPIYMNGVVFQRKLVEDVDGFNIKYQIGEDVDMIMKIVRSGYHGRFLPYVGAYLRVHSDQSTNDVKMSKMSLDKRLTWDRNLVEKELEHGAWKVGWKRYKNIEEWEQEVKDNGGKPTSREGQIMSSRMLNKREGKKNKKEVEELVGKEITPSEYEWLRGMTSGTYQDKTVHELLNCERMFLLKSKKEEDLFMERDIVV